MPLNSFGDRHGAIKFKQIVHGLPTLDSIGLLLGDSLKRCTGQDERFLNLLLDGRLCRGVAC